MSHLAEPALDCPIDRVPDPEDLLQAAMRWHFSPETGSPFWLERARALDFDPRADVRTFADLRRFPNVVDELRDVRVEDLIPRGYGSEAEVLGVYESGGTTGRPKRIVLLADTMERWLPWAMASRDRRGHPRDVNWLVIGPTGPHIYGINTREQARRRGGLTFTIDFDPRWVKRSVEQERTVEAERYAEHLIAQATHVLETQDVGVLETTPPLLTRMAREDRLVELINEKVQLVNWGGAHMDADTRHLLRTEVFPGVLLAGAYGSTMSLMPALERAGLSDDDPCIFDPFSPYVSFSVIDPETGEDVPYGERGQVVHHHVSKNALFPNNLERDIATRIEGLPGQMGDSVADVTPVDTFKDATVIEGVY